MIPYHYGKWLKVAATNTSKPEFWIRYGDFSIFHLFNKNGYSLLLIHYYDNGKLMANFTLKSEEGYFPLHAWNNITSHYDSVGDCTVDTLFARMDGVVSKYKKTGRPAPLGLNI